MKYPNFKTTKDVPANHRGPFTVGDIREPWTTKESAEWQRADAQIDTDDNFDISGDEGRWGAQEK